MQPSREGGMEGTQNKGKDTARAGARAPAPTPSPAEPLLPSTALTLSSSSRFLSSFSSCSCSFFCTARRIWRSSSSSRRFCFSSLLSTGVSCEELKFSQHAIKQNQVFALSKESTFSIPHTALDSWMTSALNASSPCHLCSR